VQAKDFDVDAQDGIGWTSLMMAASRKDADEIIDLLLSRGTGVNMTSIKRLILRLTLRD
jgi:26S proteasome non-ATPase regulatory subunit 10